MLTTCWAQRVLLDYHYHPHMLEGKFLAWAFPFRDPDFRCECQAFQAHFAYERTEALQSSCLCLTF